MIYMCSLYEYMVFTLCIVCAGRMMSVKQKRCWFCKNLYESFLILCAVEWESSGCTSTGTVYLCAFLAVNLSLFLKVLKETMSQVEMGYVQVVQYLCSHMIFNC